MNPSNMNASNMNPNFEIPKIPLTTLAGITSLTDILHELPLPGPHPDSLDYPLFAFSEFPVPPMKQLTNNTNPNIIAQIVEALSLTSTEDIILKDGTQDTDGVDGLNVPPLLQAVLTKKPDIFYKRRLIANDIASNIQHSSPVQAATPHSPAISHTGLPLYQASPSEAVAEVSSNLKNDSNNALRNQAPHSTCSNTHDTPTSSKNENIFTVENNAQPTQEENLKICLKIRRKKKSGREKEQPSVEKTSNAVEGNKVVSENNICYDIVSGPEKPATPSTGPLKLKLSRVKLDDCKKDSPSTSFQVSKVEKQNDVTPQDKGHQRVQDWNDNSMPGFDHASHKKISHHSGQSHRPAGIKNSVSSMQSLPSNSNFYSPPTTHPPPYNSNLTPSHSPHANPPFLSPNHSSQAQMNSQYMGSPYGRPPSFCKTQPFDIQGNAPQPHHVDNRLHTNQQMLPPPPYFSPSHRTPEQPSHSSTYPQVPFNRSMGHHPAHSNTTPPQLPGIPQQKHGTPEANSLRMNKANRSNSGAGQPQRTQSSSKSKKKMNGLSSLVVSSMSGQEIIEEDTLKIEEKEINMKKTARISFPINLSKGFVVATVQITNSRHVRVKFIADQEEADIYKLSDILYPDDSEVSSFEELKSGMMVVAKWPRNGKLYEALVIDPLDSTGRKFRDRKPPPKPFQIDHQGRRERKLSSDCSIDPCVVLKPLPSHQLNQEYIDISKHKSTLEGSFDAYHSLADRIKLKRQKMQDQGHGGKKRKRANSTENASSALITMDSDEDSDTNAGLASPARKISHKDMKRKKERRRMAEIKMMQEGSGSGSLRRFLTLVELIFEDMDRVDATSLQIAADEPVPECLLLPASRLQELAKESSKLKAMGILNQLPKKSLLRLMTVLELNIRAAVKLKPLAVKTDASSHEQKWQQEVALERVYAAADSALTALNLMTSPGMPKAVYLEDVIERAIQLLRFQLQNTIYPEYDSVYKVDNKKKGKGGGKDLHSASSKQKRAHYKGPKSRAVLHLYNKMISLVSLWVELLEIQPLTDTSVLQVSSVAISPFFVENVRELQLASIRLTTTVFARYERHRKLILEDLFQSLARLPTSKRNLRNFRLNYVDDDYSDDEGISSSIVMPYIQMVSALVLQMVQAIVVLPLQKKKQESDNKELLNGGESITESPAEIDELKVISSYDNAMRTGQSFLAVFLKKCASKSEDIDYRPLFENFIHDLLATVNKPEWPASEMMLSILGRLLVHTFSNRQTEASLRVTSIDYLGVITAKLRRDVVSSQLDKSVIKQLIADLDKAKREEQGFEPEKDVAIDEDTKEEAEEKSKKIVQKRKKGKRKCKRKFTKKKKIPKRKLYQNESTEENAIEKRLHDILLSYVHSNAETDPALMFAHNFYVGQWLRDVSREAAELQHKNSQQTKQNTDVNGEVEEMEEKMKRLQQCEHRKKNVLELATQAAADEEKQHKSTEGPAPPLANGVSTPAAVTPLKKKKVDVSSQLTYDNAMLITRFLASTRPFSHSFDKYLTHILLIREESAVAVRTRAIKCLAEVVAVDPSILARKDIWHGVQASLVDASTSVREAAVDLVGKFILLKPELVPQYYNMLTARILDTGVSVRKRVIKILRDLCHEHPDLPQLTDACVKMIRRVNDEEGIKKLVHEVFMRMWFTPLKTNNGHTMRLKALSIADVVAANKDIGYEWIEQMMINLIDTDEVNEKVELACQQVVNCLVDHLIQIEQENQVKVQKSEGKTNDETRSISSTSDESNIVNSDGPKNTPEAENQDEEKGADGKTESTEENAKLKTSCKSSQIIANALVGRKRSEMIAATMRTLVLFAKIRPKLLVPHVMTLQPHLATKCESGDELHTLQSVCRVLELSVPLLEHPGEGFLASLEEDLMKLILRERFLVVQSAIACLGSVTKHVTENYKLVWDCFQKLCSFLSGMRCLHQKSGFSRAFVSKHSQLLRTLFITGHFMKTFDFDDELMKGKSQVCIKDKVFECIYYFTQMKSHEELRLYAIGCLGLLMIQDPNMMFRTETKECYKKLLDQDQTSDVLKNQVLKNLQTYLSEEDVRMQEAAKASSHKKKEDPSTLGLHARKQLEQQQHQQEESEDIKEICDVSSGMASSVMQVYLKQVLECFFHAHVHVRRAAINTIFLTLNQGLVHPLQCIPFVIAMSTDADPLIFNKSEQLLTEINKRYSGFIHAKSLQGVKMAYRLQNVTKDNLQVTRGCRIVRGADENTTINKACCSQLYTLIRSDRKHRRALMVGLLNMFDDTVKTDLELLMFIADNLAYFPYLSQDEPLYVMSQIEVYVSVSGSNVLQSFKECLREKSAKVKKIKKKKKSPNHNEEEGDSINSSSSSSSSSEDSDNDISDAENERGIMSRLPTTDGPLTEFMESSMACLLLLWVKQHLKMIFGFTDNKVHRYSPNEPVKAHDKQVVRKRPDLQFEPKRVIDYLQRRINRTLPRHPSQDDEYRKNVVNQYLEFNELMNKLDPNDADSDSDRETPVKKTPKKVAVATEDTTEDVTLVSGIQEGAPENNAIQANNEEEESDRDSDAEPPKKETALDIIRKSGMSKHKNKLLKSNHDHHPNRPESSQIPKELRARKKVVQYIESSNSEDSESEFLGF